MAEAVIVELNEEGAVTLPESIRHDLPSGTHFLIRRQEQNIILLALEQVGKIAIQSAAQFLEMLEQTNGPMMHS
jgi:hypothetical protein